MARDLTMPCDNCGEDTDKVGRCDVTLNMRGARSTFLLCASCGGSLEATIDKKFQRTVKAARETARYARSQKVKVTVVDNDDDDVIDVPFKALPSGES